MNKPSRRRFLKQSAVAAGALASTAGTLSAASRSASAIRRAMSTSILGANERFRLGVVGCGGHSRTDINAFLNSGHGVDVVALCDVDDAMLADKQKFLVGHNRPAPETTKDFRKLVERKDIDVVQVTTPDHWHPLVMIHAVQAGKDVYCEKPLANSVGESKVMLDWARKTNRVVQMGTQWRASKHMADAIAYVHSGKLGKIRLVRCWCALAWFKSVGKPADAQVPEGVDYDMWLGPAPKRPFNPARFHFQFRWFWDYAGGLMTDWGVHLLNIALWGMQVDFPKRVASVGGKYAFDDIAETPDTQNTLYDFGDFGLVWEHKAGVGHGAENREHGVAFYGQNATLIVDAGGWEVVPQGDKVPAEKHAIAEPGEACRQRLVGNFLNCVKSRQRPIEDIEIGHHVTTVAHLGNLALRTGRSIEFDAANMKVIGNEEANRMLMPEYRKPWELPKV